MDTFFSQLLQQLVNGLTLGSVYALIALGYSMVYGVLQLLNFAHGEVYMIGAFIGWSVFSLLAPGDTLLLPAAVVILFMLLAAMVGSGFLGILIEWFAYRPLRNAPRIVPLISASSHVYPWASIIPDPPGARGRRPHGPESVCPTRSGRTRSGAEFRKQ